MKLERQYIEKPWGRTRLPVGFDPPVQKRIGEVWFRGPGNQPLLVKYLFTSERLSIQVHPDDEQARAFGLASGKSECWFILDAEPGSTLGLGLTQQLSPGELRAAALDGSIEQLIEWRAVSPGDFYFVPPGTIHAIGAGLSLIEFQQNSDVTFRLYDYGRPRELHLEEGIGVARPEPYPERYFQHLSGTDGKLLVDGPQFMLALTERDTFEDRKRWIIPLEGTVQNGSETARPGECLLVNPDDHIQVQAARMLIGASASLTSRGQ